MPSSARQPSTTDADTLDGAFLDHVIDTVAETIPADSHNSPAARRQAARIALLALRPADAFQALLAAQVIAAHYAIMDAFRRAAQPELAPAMATRLRANATAMARTMQATLRTLRQAQAPDEATKDAAVPQPSPPATRTGRARKPVSPPVPGVNRPQDNPDAAGYDALGLSPLGRHDDGRTAGPFRIQIRTLQRTRRIAERGLT